MAATFRSLKGKAGAAAALMFAAGVLTAGALSYDAMSKTLDRGHRDILKAAANDGLAALAAVSDRMKVYADILGRHPGIISAVQRNDIKELEKVIVGEFKAIHGADPALATLEVTDNKGIVILRGHNPAKRGDNKASQPQIQTALSGKPAGGLTVSPTTGEAAEDSVRPIISDGSVIGTLKVGSYFNEASAEELKKANWLGSRFRFARQGYCLDLRKRCFDCFAASSDRDGLEGVANHCRFCRRRHFFAGASCPFAERRG